MNCEKKKAGFYSPRCQKMTAGMWLFSIVTLVGWALLILWLICQQTFDSDPPLQTAVAILSPIALYLLAIWQSTWFRSLVHATDPVLLSLTQSWRILGALFIPLYVYGHLPGEFALPTGIGDIVIAVAAVFIPYSVIKGTIALNSPWMWVFHILGILDLVIAVSCRVLFHANAMGQAPLVFIPAYLVPLWIIFHLMVIENMRKTGCAKDCSSP